MGGGGGGMGGLNLLPNFQKEVMTGSQSLKEGYLERGVNFFRKCSFYIKKYNLK